MTETVPSSPPRSVEDGPDRPAWRGWAAVAAVAAATFTVVTSEMLPVGLLTSLSPELGVSEGVAGLTLTVTGLVAAVAAPLVTPAVGRLDRRAALCGLMLVLAIGNLMSAWAPHFGVMMAGRTLVGVGMGGVWALAASLAPRLVPPPAVGGATSLIFSGVAVASVLGVPAGTYLGEAAGWRMALASAGLLALLVALALFLLLPRLPVARAVRLGGMARLARERAVRTGLVVVALLVTGHFAAYTYVRPVLEKISGAAPALISALLLAYGVAGIAGNFVSAAGAARSPRATLMAISAVLGAVAVLFPEIGTSVLVGTALLVLWGLAYGGVSVSTQTWLVASAPHAREAASGLFVGVFNASIALGSAIGGRVVDALGVAEVLWVGGGLALAALVAVTLGPSPAGGRE
ncbi:MFS transporter [Streptoalloteichus hindustanus]|nr:MFS transporter [Streptoalloteichus hindustanus]